MRTLIRNLRDHLSWEPKPTGDYRAWVKMQLSRLSCGFTETGFDYRQDGKLYRARVVEACSEIVYRFHYVFLMNVEERRYDREMEEAMRRHVAETMDEDPEA